jgi:hypothetical protein
MNKNLHRRSLRRLLPLRVGAAVNAGALAVLMSDCFRAVIP